MRIEVTIEGLDDAVRELIRKDPEVHRAIGGAMHEAAYIVEARVKAKVLEPPKTGRLYKRAKTVVHQASAPGEAPASDTGNLVGNITQDVDESALEARISAQTPYAAALEFGTKKMEPRPFMRPALVESEKDVVDAVRDAIRKVRP